MVLGGGKIIVRKSDKVEVEANMKSKGDSFTKKILNLDKMGNFT